MLDLRSTTISGITPACAGIASFALILRTQLWDHPRVRGNYFPQTHWLEILHRDHPRVCGNYDTLPAKCSSLIGSPPRVRELLIPQYLLTFTDRITPANAGSTYNSSRTHFHLQDHHRVCGNYDSLVWATRQELKSPPRARELLGQLRVLVLFVGITPACAEILNINQYIAIKLVHKSLIYSGQFL